MTDAEIEKQAHALGVAAPLPLKMAAVAAWQARDIKKSLAGSSLPPEALQNMRRSGDRWISGLRVGRRETTIWPVLWLSI
jgi:hypothetical protein